MANFLDYDIHTLDDSDVGPEFIQAVADHYHLSDRALGTKAGVDRSTACGYRRGAKPVSGRFRRRLLAWLRQGTARPVEPWPIPPPQAVWRDQIVGGEWQTCPLCWWEVEQGLRAPDKAVWLYADPRRIFCSEAHRREWWARFKTSPRLEGETDSGPVSRPDDRADGQHGAPGADSG